MTATVGFKVSEIDSLTPPCTSHGRIRIRKRTMRPDFKKARLPVLLFTSLMAANAIAADIPDMKAGLWSSSVQMGTNPARTGQMCTNNDITKQLDAMAKNASNPCKAIQESHTGSIYTIRTQCTFNGQTHTSSSTTTVTGNIAMHTELNADDGMHMVTDSKYVGACPAGMNPGDYVDSSGMKFNMLKGPSAAPQPQSGTPSPPPPGK